jgi:hypothetical protein
MQRASEFVRRVSEFVQTPPAFLQKASEFMKSPSEFVRIASLFSIDSSRCSRNQLSVEKKNGNLLSPHFFYCD